MTDKTSHSYAGQDRDTLLNKDKLFFSQNNDKPTKQHPF